MDTADIVIIGAGAGAKLIWGSVPGRSVAVVEQELVGGYCPFYACVPSKAMLRPIDLVAAARRSPGASQAVTGPVDADAVLAPAHDLLMRFVFMSLALFGLAGTGAWLVSRRITKPLSEATTS